MEKRKDPKRKVHVFMTSFYQILKRDPQRCAQRLPKDVNIFEQDFVFIPINDKAHWTLCIIDIKNKLLLYLDSLGGSNTQASKHIRLYLSNRHTNEMAQKASANNNNNENNNTGGSSSSSESQTFGKSVKYRKLKVPEQSNHCDCGVFLLHYADLFLALAEQDKWDPENPPDDTWFELSDIPSKRARIKELIELQIRQNPCSDASQSTQQEGSLLNTSSSLNSSLVILPTPPRDGSAAGGTMEPPADKSTRDKIVPQQNFEDEEAELNKLLPPPDDNNDDAGSGLDEPEDELPSRKKSVELDLNGIGEDEDLITNTKSVAPPTEQTPKSAAEDNKTSSPTLFDDHDYHQPYTTPSQSTGTSDSGNHADDEEGVDMELA